jgi:hypothetical protein
VELDQNQELSIQEMKIIGCSFFFASTPSQQKVGIWKYFALIPCIFLYEQIKASKSLGIYQELKSKKELCQLSTGHRIYL